MVANLLTYFIMQENCCLLKFVDKTLFLKDIFKGNKNSSFIPATGVAGDVSKDIYKNSWTIRDPEKRQSSFENKAAEVFKCDSLTVKKFFLNLGTRGIQ